MTANYIPCDDIVQIIRTVTNHLANVTGMPLASSQGIHLRRKEEKTAATIAYLVIGYLLMLLVSYQILSQIIYGIKPVDYMKNFVYIFRINSLAFQSHQHKAKFHFNLPKITFEEEN
uniref:Uncharacterized protein n=1 Tax=Glossina austeni TaxID=7395 RepID=A0A1A9UU71_GLOAU